MKATIITIGTEILIGQIVDTNSAYIGEKLGEVGVEIVSRISVNDKREDMLKALNRGIEDADLLILTGGLGPTRDDITKVVLAEFLGVDMYFDEDQYARILRFFQTIKRPTTEAHKQQCNFPSGITFLDNDMGTAAGMLFHYQGKRIISMPGVPYEMKHIMEERVLPMLVQEQTDHLVHMTIQTAGIGETILAGMIEDLEDNLPEHLAFAYLPSLGKVRVRISGKGQNKELLTKELEEYKTEIIRRLGSYYFGADSVSLQETVGELLKERNMMLGLAESCTGGKLASVITETPGSSAYFEGGVVSYTNTLKNALLGVQKETLRQYGAVSEETVKEMVIGAVKLLKTDVAIAVSGIAGPTGGTPNKPVGTVWLCVGNEKKQITRVLNLTKNRIKNIEYSTNAALNLLRLYLTDNLS